MQIYEKVFFEILRASLWKTSVVIPEGFTDWTNVMRLAKVQALTGLVADVSISDPCVSELLPEDFIPKLNRIRIVNVSTYYRLSSTLIMVVTAMRKYGIEPVLLKGQSMARNYPVPELRQCGDIDLYVGTANYESSYEALKQIADEIDEPDALTSDEKHFHAKIANSVIEVHKYADIHSSSTFNKIYQKYADRGLSCNLVKMHFGDMDVSSPEDNFNAFYVFNHMWHHFMAGGVGLRQVCDWIMFLHSRAGKLDLDYLYAILNEMKLLIPWQAFGCIAVDVLGLPAEEFPFYTTKYRSKADKVLKRIMEEGNFGQQTAFVRKHQKGYLYEKLFSLKCHIERFFGMVTLFPRHAMMQVWYAVSSGIGRVFGDIFHRN